MILLASSWPLALPTPSTSIVNPGTMAVTSMSGVPQTKILLTLDLRVVREVNNHSCAGLFGPDCDQVSIA